MTTEHTMIPARLTEASRKDLTAALKVAIAKNNAAMVECHDILVLKDRVYALGHTHSGHFATWDINTTDHSSHTGHYDFLTRDDARRDMFKRAGLPLGSLDQLI